MIENDAVVLLLPPHAVKTRQVSLRLSRLLLSGLHKSCRVPAGFDVGWLGPAASETRFGACIAVLASRVLSDA